MPNLVWSQAMHLLYILFEIIFSHQLQFGGDQFLFAASSARTPFEKLVNEIEIINKTLEGVENRKKGN